MKRSCGAGSLLFGAPSLAAAGLWVQSIVARSRLCRPSPGSFNMAKTRKLGELLTEWGVTSAKEIDKGLDHAKAKRMRLGEALIDLKLCNESQVYKALAQQNNME